MASIQRRCESLAVGTQLDNTCVRTKGIQREMSKLENNSKVQKNPVSPNTMQAVDLPKKGKKTEATFPSRMGLGQPKQKAAKILDRSRSGDESYVTDASKTGCSPEGEKRTSGKGSGERSPPVTKPLIQQSRKEPRSSMCHANLPVPPKQQSLPITRGLARGVKDEKKEEVPTTSTSGDAWNPWQHTKGHTVPLTYTSPSWQIYDPNLSFGDKDSISGPSHRYGDQTHHRSDGVRLSTSLPIPHLNPRFYHNVSGSPIQTASPPIKQPKENKKKQKSPNTKNGQTRGQNAQNNVANALNRAASDVKGQADGLHEAIRVQRENEDETKKIEKKKKEYEIAVGRLPTKYQRNLGLYLLQHWSGSYYSDSPALRSLVCQFQLMGLELQLSRNPDIVLGMLLDIKNVAPPTYHLLPASLSSHPEHEYDSTPFYDQMISTDYHSRIGQDYPQVDWADGEQAVLCTDPTGKPDWVPIPRFGYSQLPLSMPGKVLSGRIVSPWFFADSLVRTLIKPNRTFSEMGFSSNVQILLGHASRPSYVEWFYDLTNQAVLSSYHENAIMYNVRTSYGDRRHTYDDCAVEACTGIKVAGYGVSFASVVESHSELLVPAAAQIEQKVSLFVDQIKETLAPGPDTDPPAPGPPDASVPQAVAEFFQDINDGISLPEIPSASELSESGSSFILSLQDTATTYLQTQYANVSVNIEEGCQSLVSFPRECIDSIHVFLSSFSSANQIQQYVREWWTENIIELGDSTIETLLQCMSDLMAGWIGHISSAHLELEEKEDVSRLLMIYTFGLLLWQRLFTAIEHVMCTHLNVPVSVYYRLKERFLAQAEIVKTLMARQEIILIPVVLLSSNYCPSLSEPINIKRQLIGERHIRDEAPGFYSEPMSVSWQEYLEVDPDLGPIPIREYGNNLLYDETRIQITPRDGYLPRPGRFSEIHYGLFIQYGRCYGQNYAMTCTKKRLGRSIEKAEDGAVAIFGNFVRNLTMPTVEVIHEHPCVSRDEYSVYTENMPRASQKKHMDYFDSLSCVSKDEKNKTDSLFVKSDEMIASPKGRSIINPPPSLFYELVIGISQIKKALKREVFNLVYDGDFRLYLSYGADMDADQKSAWFKKARVPLSDKPCAYVLIGGDDNGSTIHYNGEVLAWESDVTACDQSHNEELVKAMSEAIRLMMLGEDWIEALMESYSRPISTEEFTVLFLEWQLHTGHPQTSTCNSLLIGLLALYFLALFLRRVISGRRPWPTNVQMIQRAENEFNYEAKKVGMVWKNQLHLEVMDLTFHKGCWMPCNGGHYQWMPLPSCLWKAFKIRTDQKISNKDLLLRLAFNLYQKLVNPNMSFVQDICNRQFNYIIKDVLKMKGGDPRYIFQQYINSSKMSKNMVQFIESFRNKSGEIPVLSESLNRQFDWSSEHEDAFCSARYGCTPDELKDLSMAGSWDGSFGVLVSPFLRTAIYRDYMSTHDEFASEKDSHLITDPSRLLECL